MILCFNAIVSVCGFNLSNRWDIKDFVGRIREYSAAIEFFMTSLLLDFYDQCSIFVQGLQEYQIFTSGLHSAAACHSCHRARMLTDHNKTDNHTPTASLKSGINLTCMTLSAHMERTCQLHAERPQLTSGLKPTTLLLWGNDADHCITTKSCGLSFFGKWIILERKWRETL